MHVKAMYPVILDYAWYSAVALMTPETTDTEEEGIEYDVIIDNYIAAQMVEVLVKMNSLI